jgi:hypothetical protein
LPTHIVGKKTEVQTLDNSDFETRTDYELPRSMEVKRPSGFSRGKIRCPI